LRRSQCICDAVSLSGIDRAIADLGTASARTATRGAVDAAVTRV
jgi:hypothetical protein